MYSPEQLLVWNIDELKKILTNPTEANLFHSSGRLRSLLLDGNPIINQANRNLRLKLSFVVTALTPRPPTNHPAAQGLVYSAVVDAIAPNPMFPQLPQKTLDLAGFLKHEVFNYKDQVATVREIVKYVANHAGYIHNSRPDSVGTESLEEAALTIRVEDMPSVLRNLSGIAQVVVTACEPLYSRLRA